MEDHRPHAPPLKSSGLVESRVQISASFPFQVDISPDAPLPGEM